MMTSAALVLFMTLPGLALFRFPVLRVRFAHPELFSDRRSAAQPDFFHGLGGSGQAIGSEWLIGHRWRGQARNGPAPFQSRH